MKKECVNYSRFIVTNVFSRTSLQMTFCPRDVEGATSILNYQNNSQVVVFVMLSVTQIGVPQVGA